MYEVWLAWCGGVEIEILCMPCSRARYRTFVLGLYLSGDVSQAAGTPIEGFEQWSMLVRYVSFAYELGFLQGVEVENSCCAEQFSRGVSRLLRTICICFL